MCDCLATINRDLVEHNTKIMLPMIGRRRPFVETMKLDAKKRVTAVKVIASYCPFCGEKYEDAA